MPEAIVRSFIALLAGALWLAPLGLAQQGPYASNVPPELHLPVGTWITVRTNETISSHRNQPGEYFTATLVQPIVVNGFVIARRGQILEGRVAVAEKSGRVKGTSSLGLEITNISLVDGQHLPVLTQLIEYVADPSRGEDAVAIAATTGIGAAIGAAADGGRGAGIGALAGAVAGAIGVLASRGQAIEIYPESHLTFRLEEPVSIYTAQSAVAFQPVQQSDYAQTVLRHRSRYLRAPNPYPRYYGGVEYYYNYPRYYRGPTFFFYTSPRHRHYRSGHYYRPRHHRPYRSPVIVINPRRSGHGYRGRVPNRRPRTNVRPDNRPPRTNARPDNNRPRTNVRRDSNPPRTQIRGRTRPTINAGGNNSSPRRQIRGKSRPAKKAGGNSDSNSQMRDKAGARAKSKF